MLEAATNSFLGISNNKTGLQTAEKSHQKSNQNKLPNILLKFYQKSYLNMLPKIVRWTAYIKLVNVNKECNK